MTDGNAILEVLDVHKRFRDVTAVDGISLRVAAGEFVALLGPNGAGKTTLVEMIEGIQRPDRGDVWLFGMRWNDGARVQQEIRRRIGVSLQETRFFDRVTVGETIDLFGSFYGAPASRRREVLRRVRLIDKERAYAQNLSGGQRQRLALAVALLGDPELLLLDEPTTGLDPNARRDVWDVLEDMRGRTTLLLTTHYMEEAERLCERIVVMDQGRILAEGALDELLRTHGLRELIEFSVVPPYDGAAVSGALERVGGVREFTWSTAEGRGRLVVDAAAPLLPQVVAAIERTGAAIAALEARRMTLDDLFVHLTGRRLDD